MNAAFRTIRYATGDSSLGKFLVAESDCGLCAILLGDDTGTLEADLALAFPGAGFREDAASLAAVLAQVADFLDLPAADLDLPFDTGGTLFQERVWQALRAIPAGSTATYTEIAGRIGHPQAVRAVARACAANRLAAVVPCHRVTRRDGALSGFRWGMQRKRLLLERESL